MKIEITRGDSSSEGSCQSCGARHPDVAQGRVPEILHVNLVRLTATFSIQQGFTLDLAVLRLCDACLPRFVEDLSVALHDHEAALDPEDTE